MLCRGFKIFFSLSLPPSVRSGREGKMTALSCGGPLEGIERRDIGQDVLKGEGEGRERREVG